MTGSGDGSGTHGNLSDDVEAGLWFKYVTEYEAAFDADIEWRPRSNVVNQYKSVTSTGASKSVIAHRLFYTPGVRNTRRLVNKTSLLVNTEYNMVGSSACVCDYVSLYRRVKGIHCDRDKCQRECACYRKVCDALHRVVCLGVLEELDRIRKTYNLYTHNYCEKHGRWLSLESSTDYYELVSVYGLRCTEILPGICFHDGISTLYVNNFNESLFNSDLHVALCNYMYYMYGRVDRDNTVAPIVELNESGQLMLDVYLLY